MAAICLSEYFLICFVSSRRSQCLMPNCLSPAPYLVLCARIFTLPSASSCLRVLLTIMVVILRGKPLWECGATERDNDRASAAKPRGTSRLLRGMVDAPFASCKLVRLRLPAASPPGD